MQKISQLKIGLYEKAVPLQLSWPEKFAVVKAAGYDFLELSIDGVEPRIKRLDWTDGEMADIQRASQAAGVPLLTLALTANRFYPLGDPDQAVRERGMAIVRRGIEIAQFLGIRLIQLAAYDVFQKPGTPETDRQFRQSLKELVKTAASSAVMLSLEVMDLPYANTTQKVTRLIQEVDSPWLQIYADIGNITAGGVDPAVDLPVGGQHILCTHLKDATPGCCRDVPFGAGIVDFKRCFQTFMDLDYSGLFVVETWSKEDLDFIPYLKVANQFIREQIREAEFRPAQRTG